MEWNVKNALNRDVEREHLNKILKEIKGALSSLDSSQVSQDQIRTIITTIVEQNGADPVNFSITLEGNVSGTGEVVDGGDVVIVTTVDPTILGIPEAPQDSNVYWRGQATWQAVPGKLRSIVNLDGQGLVIYSTADGWLVREIEGVAGEIIVTDGDGVDGNPVIGLDDVTPVAGGVLQKYGFDSKGRRSEEEAATTDDLDEGATNLYFTDERAQDAVGTILVDTADIELDYDDSAPSISAVLTTAVHDSLALADASIQPGDNISELVNDEGFLDYTALKDALVAGTNITLTPDDLAETITIDASGGGGSGTVTSVGMSVPTGLSVSGSPITTSGTFTVSYDTGYQGYTSAEATKLSGIAAGATVGANWLTNLSNIPANIVNWSNTPVANPVLGATTGSTTGTNQVTVNSNGYAGILIQGDYSNASGEPGGAFVKVTVDGPAGTTIGILSYVNTAGTDGGGGTLTGTLSNSTVVGNLYSAGALHWVAGGAVVGTISSAGATTFTGTVGAVGTIEITHPTQSQLTLNPAGGRTIQLIANSTPNTGFWDATAGAWLLRINSANDAIFTGNVTCTGSNLFVGTAGQLRSNNMNVVLSSTATGGMYLRPNGDASATGQFTVSAAGTAAVDGVLLPATDNARTCGASGSRWSVVYAGTGTINTSDAREKTNVIPLTADELAAASQLAKEIGKYKWLEAVAKKGDAARSHIGLTVQRAIEVMESHGLDPFEYGFICYDEWEATDAVVDDGEVMQPAKEAGDRYSFRPDELLMFIARGHEERLARLEALLDIGE